MILNIVFLIAGLAFILVGANMLTDGASSIAKRWGLSELVIGLTVVAFGTSAPELVISIVSAINGSAELAIGNVVRKQHLQCPCHNWHNGDIRPYKD